jgi:hypothetical protein
LELIFYMLLFFKSNTYKNIYNQSINDSTE